MSDAVAGLLFELYETDRATAYSNLLVGIVFGEQPSGLYGKVADVSNGALPLISPIIIRTIVPRQSWVVSTQLFIFLGAYVVLYGTSLYILL
jgi:hypothetical protein